MSGPTHQSSQGTALGAGRVDALEGYRAVAALVVLASHVAGHVGFIEPYEPGAHLIDNLGGFGVAVFFVISGFVITRPFIAASIAGRQRPDTASYLIRRALRIYPAYWLALVVWAMFASAEHREPGSPLAIFLLIDPYVSVNERWLTGLFVSWSLTVELVFYLFVPLYAVVVDRIVRRASDLTGRVRVHLIGVAVLYVTAFAYRAVIGDHASGLPPSVINWLPCFLDWFALGMLLSVLTVWRDAGGMLPDWVTALPRRTGAAWTLSAVAYCILVALKGDQLLFDRTETPGQMSWRFFFQGMTAFWFVVPAVLGTANQPPMAFFRSRPMVFLGSISYGIYLWHAITLLWVEDLFDDWTARSRFVVLTLVVSAITVPIAAASYRWLERPMMGLAPRQRSPLMGTTSAPRATLSPETPG